MPLRIDQDRTRFNSIIRGKVRENLKKYITQDNLIGKKGKDLVSIPIPHIETPRFRFGDKQQGGVGQGDGDKGDPVGGDQGEGPGKGKAGQGEGEHLLEVELTMDELADILSAELELPNIENKGRKNLETESKRYSGIQRFGAEGLRHFKRTYKEALKREISSGTWVPGQPVIPRREDKRYKAPEVTLTQSANAVIIYMMDVSGSMGDEQKHIVRTMSFWMNAWIKKQYKGLASRYIIHDSSAKEVDEDTFFRTRESGGTTISSAYKKCAEVMQEYPFEDWNVYCFHFSDGDNWSPDDTAISIGIVNNDILPRCNMFGYGQVDSPHGSGSFIGDFMAAFANEPKAAATRIPDRDHIMPAIKDFLGKGR